MALAMGPNDEEEEEDMLHPSKFGLTARRTYILRTVDILYSKCYFVVQIHIRCNRSEVY